MLRVAGLAGRADPCSLHATNESGLSCGRCSAAVCARCVVASPVGTRCRNCAPPPTTRHGPESQIFGVDFGTRARVTAIPLIVAAVVAIVAFSWANGDRDRLVVRSIVFGGFFLSTIFHEWAHSLVAYLGGDREIRARGFLTWNVFRYMDPVMSVGMPLLFVMLGGLPLMGARTMVDRHALRGRWWSTFMSLAGPATNLALAVVIVAVLRAGLLPEESPVAWGLAFLCVLQITTSMFNLAPIPGFDGFGAFLPHLSHETQVRAMAFSRISFFLVLAVMWSSPETADAFWEQVYHVADALRVPDYEWYMGWSLSRLR